MSKRTVRMVYILLPIMAVILCVGTRSYLIALSRYLPACHFYQTTGWYCAGCGNTRAVHALLAGDVVASFRYNVAPLLLLSIGGLAYAEWGTYLFGKHRRLLPRHWLPWTLLAVGYVVYLIARNVWEWMPV